MKRQREEVNNKPKQENSKKQKAKRKKGLKNQEQIALKPAENSGFSNITSWLVKQTTFCTKTPMCHFWEGVHCARTEKTDSCRTTVVSKVFKVFFVLIELWKFNMHHFCPISVSPQEGHKHVYFSKPDAFTKIVVLELKTHKLFQNMHFLWHTNLQLVNQFFRLPQKRFPSKKLFIVFLKHNFSIQFSKKWHFEKRQNILGKIMAKKKEVTNWAKAKNTNWHQNVSTTKVLKNLFFVVWKWSPKRWYNF